jgi:anti-sigma factor RsiW
MTCSDAVRLLARAADDPSFGDAALDAHLAACDACRAALGEQRAVSARLHARPADAPSQGFSARVAAALDRHEADTGMLGLANWRAWGGGLAPVAAALMLAAWLGVGLDRDEVAPVTAESFDTWTRATADDDRAVAFLHPDATRDLLLETVLTGALPQDLGDPDVR